MIKFDRRYQTIHFCFGYHSTKSQRKVERKNDKQNYQQTNGHERPSYYLVPSETHTYSLWRCASKLLRWPQILAPPTPYNLKTVSVFATSFAQDRRRFKPRGNRVLRKTCDIQGTAAWWPSMINASHLYSLKGNIKYVSENGTNRNRSQSYFEQSNRDRNRDQ